MPAQKIAILTDTNSGMTPQEASALDIHLLAMPFFINGELFYEGISLSQREFYERMDGNQDISTSQPSPGDTLQMWDSLLQEADSLIYIPMSSGLSSTVDTAQTLSQLPEYQGKVFVVDNKRISATQRQSVYDAALLRSRGLSAAEISDFLHRTAMDARIYIMVDTLKYLKKGGRVTAAGALLGDALNIKPILQIAGDKLDAYKKVRGIKAAKEAMLEVLAKDIAEDFAGQDVLVMTAYSGDPAAGEEWNRTVQQYFPNGPVYNAPLPLSIACHTGPGALGIGCVKWIR